MQNKGAITTFAILLAAVCLYQLTFTWKAQQIENRAKEYAQGNSTKEYAYLDSISGVEVYNFLGIKKFTFKEVKELEMNLGLDLKGGMNVTLEVSVVDVIRAMSNYSTDSTFNAALRRAVEMQRNSTQDFVTLFGQAFAEVDPNARLAAIFNTLELKDRVKFDSSNEDVLKVIRTETDAAIDNSFNVLRTRIDRFGVAQPNIQQLQTRGRILVELPGIDNPERVRKLLQGTAQLEFWETYENQEVYPYMLQANQRIRELTSVMPVAADSMAADTLAPASLAEVAATDTLTSSSATASETTSLLDEMKSDSSAIADGASPADLENFRKEYPLFAVLNPSTDQTGNLFPGPVVGTAHAKDTSEVNAMLAREQVRALFPRNMFFRWTANSVDKEGSYFRLIALKSTSRDGKAPLTGDVITDARQDYDQMGGRPEVSMSMNSEGAKTWARMTKENINKSIAIVLDNYVRSFPTVQNEITGGRSSITGLESIEEATDLANILKSGKMPAPARIMQEEVVGPSLGKEAINSGFASFGIAFLMVLLYMLFFYSRKAGLAANMALLFNVFFLVGILASLGAVLTLPGIAGIVLTMGMAVDANVLIYERIQEEVWAGKGLKLAITDGYKNAYSAIIDGQVTTLLTGIVLYIFGSGPIKGFATTLIIGILTSLFTAIFITRILFEWQLKRNINITFTSKTTANWLRNTKIKFIENRKIAYYISGTLITLSILSFIVRGFDLGIDFQGGRTYTVRFNKEVKVADVREALAEVYGAAPEVKTFGSANQVRITTKFKVDDMSDNVDGEVEQLLYKGLTDGGFLPDIPFEEFSSNYRMSSQKVGPTISDDIKRDAVIAIFLALLAIFLYILVRFSTWNFGLGGVVSLTHDTIITLGAFSLFKGILPFSLEIDQAFIAAILTVIGYSINDTVIVFDRIREYTHLYPKRDTLTNMNHAMNSTLRRTFSTSLSTLVVLIAIFLFGGASIRGFIFALLVGIGVGTYSSVFVATPIVYETMKKKMKQVAKAQA
ncbi:MAG: protein translocase subunit SecDF [Prolixibacteraceae bacterium]|jgi:SecD/SecF fusion protein|nr:protein translocase subunit SecDF [Prolixibacteraceae bacterium]